MEKSEIVIVGGGICGLATALALHRKGMRSIILEKSETLTTPGVGIIMQPNAWRALDYLGVASILRKSSTPISSVCVATLDDGNQIQVPIGGEMRCLRRMDIVEALAQQLPPHTIYLGRKVLSVQFDHTNSSFPLLLLHDGTLLKPKIVIGCDGINSVTAKAVEPNVKLKVFSRGAIRGLTYYENGHRLGTMFVIRRTDHVTLGQLPVTNNLVYWFLTRKWNSLDKVSREAEVIKESALEAVRSFPEETVEVIRKSELKSLHMTNIRYRAPWELLATKLSRGTVTLAGDAIHPMGPFMAQGGSSSLEDAVVLARCLSTAAAQTQPNNRRRRNWAEEAVEEYSKQRRMRIFWVALQTYLSGITVDTPSLLIKLLCTLLLKCLFRDPDAHTRYDCTQQHKHT